MEATFRTFNAGEVIFRQGDPGDCAYLIETGRVQISIKQAGDDCPINILGEGQVFGEGAILKPGVRAFTVTALTLTRACVITETAGPEARMLLAALTKGSRELTPVTVLHLTEIAREAIDFEAEIKSAFTRQEFFLNYQPIVELKTAATVGFEALMRWKSPKLGMVSPADFIPAIEKSPMMFPIGRWIIEQAMMGARQLGKKLGPHISVNINISPKQFMDPAFVAHLESTRESLGLKTAQIKLEITEQVFVESVTAIAVIEECRNLGYQICLDDFGTGYSSIAYLKQMNLDVLKIDQSFIRQTKLDDKSKRIIKAMISLGNDLAMTCVAEGIESAEIGQTLIDLGCGYGQGYHYGRPQTLEHYLGEVALPAKKVA